MDVTVFEAASAKRHGQTARERSTSIIEAA